MAFSKILKSLQVCNFFKNLIPGSDKSSSTRSELTSGRSSMCNVLRNKESEVKNCRNMKWRILELNKERRELLKLIGDSFFSETSVTPIPLTNQVKQHFTNSFFSYNSFISRFSVQVSIHGNIPKISRNYQNNR